MAASLDTPPAGALRAGDSPALGGSAADIIFTIYLLLLLQYSLFSSLFFFFYTWLPKVSFDYSDRFYCYHYFSSSMFTILTSPSGSLLIAAVPWPLTWHLRLVNSLQKSVVSTYFISWIFECLLSPQFNCFHFKQISVNSIWSSGETRKHTFGSNFL